MGVLTDNPLTVAAELEVMGFSLHRAETSEFRSWVAVKNLKSLSTSIVIYLHESMYVIELYWYDVKAGFTKQDYYQKPTFENIRKSVKELSNDGIDIITID